MVKPDFTLNPQLHNPQPPPNVIGLCGYKRAGKDEVYKALAQHHEHVARLAFADPLKQEMARACAVAVGFIEDHKDAFRLGLQWWGTDFRRTLFGRDYWITKIEAEYCALVNPPWLGHAPSCVVFTDCRFPNELDLIRRLGGKIWRVERADQPGSEDPHPSERALDDHRPDRVLVSHSGQLIDFHHRILQAYAEDFPPANVAADARRL